MILRPNRIPALLQETIEFHERIKTAGAEITMSQLQSVDRFVRDCKRNEIWDRLQEVYPFVGKTLTAALIKLKYMSNHALTSVNFLAGDYGETTGLQGDGSTKYLNTNFIGTDIFATGHMAFYQRTDLSTTGARVSFGLQNGAGTQHWWLGSLNPATQADGRYQATPTANSATPQIKGLYYLERFSATSLILYRNNVFLASSPTNVSYAPQALNAYMWARNNNGTPDAYSSATGSFFSFGLEMLNATVRAAYHTSIQQLQTDLGRAV